MKKITKKWWFWLIIILIISITIYVTYKIKEEEELNKAIKNIADGMNSYINGINNAESYSDDFKYNYETEKVEYHPKITLQKYNRIEKEMSEKSVIAILGDYDNKVEGDNIYLLEWGNIPLNGYLVQIFMDKKENKVIIKSQVGLN